MQQTALVGLIRIELPGHDIRLCDGGFMEHDGLVFQAEDDVFGTIGLLDAMSEGVGDEVPAGKLTFIPRTTAAAAQLSKPGFQNSRMRFWIGEFDVISGRLVSPPDLMMEAQTDQTILRRGRGTRELEMRFVSRAERLFTINEGNTLSARFHRSIYPGESGFDRATGVPTQRAWGTSAPPRGVSSSSSGGSYGVADHIYGAMQYAR